MNVETALNDEQLKPHTLQEARDALKTWLYEMDYRSSDEGIDLLQSLLHYFPKDDQQQLKDLIMEYFRLNALALDNHTVLYLAIKRFAE